MAEMNTLVVGNDLGYGDLKISIDNEITTQPTVISPIEQILKIQLIILIKMRSKIQLIIF